VSVRSARAKRGPQPATGTVGQAAPAVGTLPPWLPWLSIVLAGLVLVGLFSTEAAHTDFWWHLKTGQYVLQKQALPIPDPFSFTTALNPPANPNDAQVQRFNLTHEWLAQALMYAVYSVGGFPLIVLARALLLAGLCGLAGWLAARRTGQVYFGIAAALAAATLAIHFAADRPALVTFFMAALFVCLLDSGRFLWALPLLGLIWANCHGGFFIGWIIVLAYATASFLPGGQITGWTKLWIIAACTIAISGLNPNGFGVVATLVRYRQSAMQASIVEWHRPYLWGPPYAFDVLLYLAAAVLIYSWRKIRWIDWILFAAFGAMALVAFRNTPFIAFLAPVLIASYFPISVRPPRFAAWLVPPALASVLIYGAATGRFFQLHAATWNFPVGAADFLLENHIRGPIFNTWEDGGYLMWRLWPEQQVFIDGRALSEAAHRDYMQILYNRGSDVGHVAGPRAELLRRYGIRSVVMNTFEYVTGAIYPLALALADNPDWRLVYTDSHSVVFVKADRPDPASVPMQLQRVMDHMDIECSDYIEHDPRFPGCARRMAQYWLEGRNYQRAYRMLSIYLSHDSDPEAERVFRQLVSGGR
jgi:hypothetical protein